MDYREQFFQECKSHVPELSGLSVLIPGCGPGKDCVPFIAEGAHVTGIDIRADLGNAYSHPNLGYHQYSIEGCDLPSNQFDIVFCIATMEHVQGIEAGFAEMVRVTRPGGLIYSVAAPLWNSRRGHHLDCLNPFPWIHLRSKPEQIVKVAHQHGLTHGGVDLGDVMDFLFVSDSFNRAPAARYVAACSSLPVSRVLRNDLWLDGEEELTPSVMEELAAKGYTREGLLATSHTFVARK